MALMYPERIAADVKSSAERLLFEQLARQLPDDYVVMHSVKWLTRDRQRFDRDGEADFLIIHRDLGVLVLTPRSERTSMLKEGQQVGSMRLTWARNPGPGQVQLGSIHGYKGLESPVVVLAELDRLHFDHRDELLYVATSRARSHLIILGQLPEPD